MSNSHGIYQKLLNIQQKLKCEKGQYNKFGNFYYRSCEDILESLKPLLEEEKCVLIMTDEIVEVGGKTYVKAIGEFVDLENDTQLHNVGYARESNEKKGMDDSQITGTASSYARKYMLNGLFLIDDTTDADTNEYQKMTAKSTQGESKAINSGNVSSGNKQTGTGPFTTHTDGKLMVKSLKDGSWLTVSTMNKAQMQWAYKCEKYKDVQSEIESLALAKFGAEWQN